MRGFTSIRALFLLTAVAATALLGGPLLFNNDVEATSAKPHRVRAKAELAGCMDDSIRGSAHLVEEATEEGVKTVRVRMRLRGLADGKYAVHLHETAECTPCGAAGGHFDPGPVGLPSPDGNHPFHMGDLRNLVVKNGKGKLDTVTTRVTLSDGPLSLFDDNGSAFIVHVNEDTYCPEGEAAGCAGGGRAACGIIQLSH